MLISPAIYVSSCDVEKTLANAETSADIIEAVVSAINAESAKGVESKYEIKKKTK